jgi:hypothetical protein
MAQKHGALAVSIICLMVQPLNELMEQKNGGLMAYIINLNMNMPLPHFIG